MDMSFARRRTAKPDAATPDLAVLLSEMSARQGSSRTALIQARLQSATAGPVIDPLVEIFAPEGPAIAVTHRFSSKIPNPVIPRQLK